MIDSTECVVKRPIEETSLSAKINWKKNCEVSRNYS